MGRFSHRVQPCDDRIGTPWKGLHGAPPPPPEAQREAALPGLRLCWRLDPGLPGPQNGETGTSVLVLRQLNAPRPRQVVLSVHHLCCYQTNRSGKLTQRINFAVTQPPAASTGLPGKRGPGGPPSGECAAPTWSSAALTWTETGRGGRGRLVPAPQAVRGRCALGGRAAQHERPSSEGESLLIKLGRRAAARRDGADGSPSALRWRPPPASPPGWLPALAHPASLPAAHAACATSMCPDGAEQNWGRGQRRL